MLLKKQLMAKKEFFTVGEIKNPIMLGHQKIRMEKTGLELLQMPSG